MKYKERAMGKWIRGGTLIEVLWLQVDSTPNQMSRNRTVKAVVHVIWKDLNVQETQVGVDKRNSSLL